MRMSKLFFSFVAISLLAACGSNDSTSIGNNVPGVDGKLDGAWMVTQTVEVIDGRKNVLDFDKDSTFALMLFNANGTVRLSTISDSREGEHLCAQAQKYTLSADKMKITVEAAGSCSAVELQLVKPFDGQEVSYSQINGDSGNPFTATYRRLQQSEYDALITDLFL